MRALFDAFSLQASAPYRKRFELVRLAVDAGLVPPPERASLAVSLPFAP